MAAEQTNQVEYVITDTKKNKVIYIGTLEEYSNYQRDSMNLNSMTRNGNNTFLYKGERKITSVEFNGLLIPSFVEIKVLDEGQYKKLFEIINSAKVLIDACASYKNKGDKRYLQYSKFYSSCETKLKSFIYLTIQYPINRVYIDFISKRVLGQRLY